jgi:dihydrodipicolinate synthase/N-acetylneuraminate lyase
MNPQIRNGKYSGVVVPMVTPITLDGRLDEPSVDRLVEFLLAAGVDGIFIMGTTGEGDAIPCDSRQRLVELTVACARNRTKIFAGLGGTESEEIKAGNDYFRTGVHAVVSRPPAKTSSDAMLLRYRALLAGLDGPLLLYNMPLTANVSIPLDLIDKLIGHPKLVGIKDSENDQVRHEELLKRFGGRKDFSVFIGVGALMEKGLRLGADGIVPSAGNLIPGVCKIFCDAARGKNWDVTNNCFAQMNAAAALYQKGRTLNESLAALKAAAHWLGLCSPAVLPPLKSLSEREQNDLREEMARLHILNGK